MPGQESQSLFSGYRLDDQATLAEVRQVHDATGELLDPHSAIGTAAARRVATGGAPMIALATAHPAKFPDAVARATGQRPALPPQLADLFEREERFLPLAADPALLKAEIRGQIAMKGGGMRVDGHCRWRSPARVPLACRRVILGTARR